MRSRIYESPPRPQVVVFTGELDVYSRRRVAAELDAVDAARPLIVDLRGSAYIEASIVGELMRARNRLRAGGTATCVVVTPGSFAAQVFDLCAAREALCVCGSVDAAFGRLTRGERVGPVAAAAQK